MLTKNIYLIYPAGYHGNYLKWCIEISDLDLRKKIPLNPINYKKDSKFGGVGTSHYNVRYPTHSKLEHCLIWQLKNKPQSNSIYLINPSWAPTDRDSNLDTVIENVKTICRFDENCIFIQIHDDNESPQISYGLINCFTKWPVFGKFGLSKFYNNFDPLNCENDINLRNVIAKNDLDWGVNKVTIDNLHKDFQIPNWYDVRNYYNPHEVNEEQYVNLKKVNLNERFLSINIKNIPSDNIISLVKKLFSQYNISDNFDTQHFEEFNPEYIKVQKNLQWFSSFEEWSKTGNLDDYLLSHSIIQSQILKNIKNKMKIQWNDNWNTMNLEEINKDFNIER